MSVMLSGWGRYPQHESRLITAFSHGDVVAALTREDSGLIARGGGRAYGDAAIGCETTLSTTNLDHMRVFDPASGRLTVESGVTLAEIVETFLPRGFFPPVVPGTRHVTVGGMIAADVHGKNHWRDGGFGRHIEALTLALPDGSIVTCSLQENADLFRATIGGMGLTGVILDATFRLADVETAWIAQTTTVAQGIDEAVEALSRAARSTYAVAWLDAASRKTFGRSLIFTARHATKADLAILNPSASAFPPKGRGPLSMPFDWPAWPKRLPIRAFNELYFRRGAVRAGTAFLVGFDRYFFPLDAMRHWNRMFARRGLIQHQCVIPEGVAQAVLPDILDRFRGVEAKPVMAVLKRLGEGAGTLSFPKPGYTLAVDIPMADGVLPLLDEIDGIVVKAGGRLYLAKDACQSRATVEAGYEGLDAFRDIRRQIGAERRLVSRLSSRLSL
ncbi:MAG: FAD-binding oxidoreductase [Rhizobiaceae bacterium]